MDFTIRKMRDFYKKTPYQCYKCVERWGFYEKSIFRSNLTSVVNYRNNSHTYSAFKNNSLDYIDAFGLQEEPQAITIPLTPKLPQKIVHFTGKGLPAKLYNFYLSGWGQYYNVEITGSFLKNVDQLSEVRNFIEIIRNYSKSEIEKVENDLNCDETKTMSIQNKENRRVRRLITADETDFETRFALQRFYLYSSINCILKKRCDDNCGYTINYRCVLQLEGRDYYDFKWYNPWGWRFIFPKNTWI